MGQLKEQEVRGRATSALRSTFLIIVFERVTQLVFTAILARLIGPNEFGVMASALVVVSLPTLAAQLGMGSCIVQLKALDSRSFWTAQSLSVLASLPVFIGVVLAAPFAADWFGDERIAPVVTLLAFSILVHAWSMGPNWFLLRQLKAGTVTLVDSGGALLSTVLIALPLAFAGYGYWAPAWAFIAQGLIKLPFLWRLAHAPPITRPDGAVARKLLRTGVGYALIQVTQRVAAESDRLVVGRLLTITDLGLYSRATGLINYPNRLYGVVLDRVVFPAFALLQSEPERVRRGLLSGISLTALLSLPGTVAFLFMGPTIVVVVLGPEWAGAVRPFQILSLALYFVLSERIIGALLRGLGYPYAMLSVQVFTALCILGLSLWTARFGITGVAAAVAAASAVGGVGLAALGLRISGVRLVDFLAAHASGAATATLLAVTLGLLNLAASSRSALGMLGFQVLVGGGVLMTAILFRPQLFLGETGIRALGEGLKMVGIVYPRAHGRDVGA